jgi:hypothetical protein
MDVETPISISVTIGELDDALKSIEDYGLFLRSFDAQSGKIEDEPEKDAETVLTIRLMVLNDLEPSWSLVSERAEVQGFVRNLNWNDRVRLAPTRIGVMADYHLGWRRGSVLNSFSEEHTNTSAALVKVARDARAGFGNEVHDQLAGTLDIVETTGKELGIPIGENIQALLDTHSVSFSDGAISLHDEQGIPLRGLGVGSTRLLVTGLQRKAATQSTIILIDELEYGLEPHRIIRLLGSLGAKEKTPPLQVFMTTHSPVALRELDGSQLFVTRSMTDNHKVMMVGTTNDIQSTIRLYPDAFLASSVIVCEGASEVGLVRGLDQYRTANGHNAINAQGTALADCGGGGADKPFERAAAFHALGYRVAVVRDDDLKPTAQVAEAFIASGGKVVAWRNGRTLEDELFFSLTDDAANKMIGRAIELHGEEHINDNIKSAFQNAKNLSTIQIGTQEDRLTLGKAARTKKAGWFKSVTWMEDVARDIVGPDLANADAGFRTLVDDIFAWSGNVGK